MREQYVKREIAIERQRDRGATMVMVEERELGRCNHGGGGGGLEEEEKTPAATLQEWAVAVLLASLFYVGVKAVAEATRGILGPAGLPLVVLCLVLVIQLLSTYRGTALCEALSGGCPDTFYRVAGSPVGLVVLLLLLLLLIYVRASLFNSAAASALEQRPIYMQEKEE